MEYAISKNGIYVKAKMVVLNGKEFPEMGAQPVLSVDEFNDWYLNTRIENKKDILLQGRDGLIYYCSLATLAEVEDMWREFFLKGYSPQVMGVPSEIVNVVKERIMTQYVNSWVKRSEEVDIYFYKKDLHRLFRNPNNSDSPYELYSGEYEGVRITPDFIGLDYSFDDQILVVRELSCLNGNEEIVIISQPSKRTIDASKDFILERYKVNISR